MSENVESEEAQVPQTKILQELLKKFSDTEDAKEIQESFREICEETGQGKDGEKPYKVLSQKTEFHRAQNLRKAFDNKFNSKDYKKDGREACKNKQALVVGAGPCGLRAAIELAFLGFSVVVVEKRDTFSRNSVLQVWTFLVDDLKSLGFRELYPKFGLSDRNHVSIRRLQIVLMKIALLVGVDVQLGVEFETVQEPDDKDKGWRACLKPTNHPTSKFDFELLIVANGQQNIQLTDLGFSWTKIERKLAIAIAANFKNKNRKEDFDQEDMGGVSIMNKMEIFTELKAKTDVDIENIVYLRDETHYFVMTGKKENLLKKGVLKEDAGKKSLLNKDNIDREKLKEFAKDVASHCTKEKIELEFSEWANGEADVGMFEFTSRSHATEAALVKEAKNKKLLMGLVGDSLKQPFWPEGVGIAHGVFSVYDTAWMVYEWFSGKVSEEEVIENRKNTYNCLRAMTKESLSTIREYGIDPKKRYAEYRAMQSPKVIDKPSTSKEKPVNARKLDLGESKPAPEEKQQGVEDLMEKFGGGKKKKTMKEDETDGAAEKKKQKSKGISRLFFWRGGKKKKKKASSTEDIAVKQTDSKGKKDEKDFKRGSFRSFRRSFRMSRKKKEKRIQENKDAGNDVSNQP